jgi:salicylate hydroxylase
MMRNSKPHILIAGGGIGGLTAALSLLKRGFDVDVYEQASELKEVGAGVQLSPNGNRVLFELGVGEALMALSCEATGKEIRLWNSGHTWKLFDLGSVSVARYGYPYLTVYRPDLIEVLAQAVRAFKPDAIHLKSRVLGFTQDASGVTLQLESGTASRTVQGDALIGADGVHSVIRQGLFGADEPERTGLMAWRGVIPMERLPAHLRRPVGTNWVGPGAHVVNYPLHRGNLMNFIGVVERSDIPVESWSVRGSRDDCLMDFKGWHDDVQRMIQAIDTPFKWALMQRAPMARWSEGRVSLLGDACHPTLPFLAQGAVMALEDGFILARALEADTDIAQALHRYEAARLERTRRIVQGAADNTKRFHNPELAHVEGASAYVNREWNEERVHQRYDWLFTYDVTQVLI